MSDLIRTTRERTGLTGADLAARLGITAGAVSQMERSERDGTVKLETLDRALAAMGCRLALTARPSSPFAEFLPDAVTDRMNAALDERDGSYALRLLTHAASVVRQHSDEFSDADLATRASSLKDPRWEQLFQAVYGDAIPAARRPAWAAPSKLSRRWYVSRFAPLRERAKRTTPPRLRALNIFLDERSLSTA
ncbi:helix-turn-helix domain-containing protein [Agromyces aerolatus]|uniref:helix-turn-helix domain-containing protein n=1 Tax=Agromyces sp. LY-1074 TaxID=3074080 RepID=UPI00286147ED|nr:MULTISPECIES: helix-turn-helix domain-containing protein [unclassified Agromyces]MDR5699626.1 helix-turn-helix domain-containing protein [Agromyces sp. LY-1074]MDR5705922.1 helix-turn-helix domain-containing protein [Agromyces sp. LY-1358]